MPCESALCLISPAKYTVLDKLFENVILSILTLKKNMQKNIKFLQQLSEESTHV